VSSFLEHIAKSVLGNILKEGIKKVFKKTRRKENIPPPNTPSSPEKSESPPNEPKLSHRWRLCPLGESWTRTHPLTVPASEKGPEWKTIRRGHCRNNKSGRNICTTDELREIALLHFKDLLNDPNAMPIPDSLDFPNGNKYDLGIAGWTKFWNEILNPRKPLAPDFVKALIATESGFNIPKDVQSNIGPARGLIQITEQTRKILQNPKGELKDHLIEMTIEESRDPEVNIAAGTRWLYHKKHLATLRLKREATWEEAVAEYKGILPQLGRNHKSDEIMERLRDYYRRLKEKREPK